MRAREERGGSATTHRVCGAETRSCSALRALYAHTHTRTHAHAHTHACMHACAHTRSRAYARTQLTFLSCEMERLAWRKKSSPDATAQTSRCAASRAHRAQRAMLARAAGTAAARGGGRCVSCRFGGRPGRAASVASRRAPRDRPAWCGERYRLGRRRDGHIRYGQAPACSHANTPRDMHAHTCSPSSPLDTLTQLSVMTQPSLVRAPIFFYKKNNAALGARAG